MRSIRFTRYAWGLTVYVVAVVLWGAYVRATGSGAGCGNHWPLCNGEVIPRSAGIQTLIEFTHRVSSGLALLGVLLLLVWAWKRFPRGSAVRVGAVLTVFFMLTEALVGAGLVLFHLVAENDSMARAWVMAFHLVNTFLLLASMSLTAFWAGGGAVPRLRSRRRLSLILFSCVLGVILLGASGAVTALGDTLFPSRSLSAALQQDLSPAAHLVIRLRIYHPLIALLVAALTLASVAAALRVEGDWRARRLGRAVSVLFLVQVGLGASNVLLLAPLWLQLLHLLVSDVIWILLVLFVSTVLGSREGEALEQQPAVAPLPASPTVPRT